VLSFALLVLQCTILVPVLVLFAQVLLAMLPVRAAAPLPSPRPRIVIMIPAHNEEAGLPATLSSLQIQLGITDRILSPKLL
jgi:hypothetical protein